MNVEKTSRMVKHKAISFLGDFSVSQSFQTLDKDLDLTLDLDLGLSLDNFISTRPVFYTD